jgi:hypothetical protein
VLHSAVLFFAVAHGDRRGARRTTLRKCVDKRATLIELNDLLRTTFKGGRVQMTRDFFDLDARLRGRALWTMSRYNKFDADSAHDSGVFIFAGYSFEWYIEYRDRDCTGVSPDPADPDKTFRVLTLCPLPTC